MFACEAESMRYHPAADALIALVFEHAHIVKSGDGIVQEHAARAYWTIVCCQRDEVEKPFGPLRGKMR